MGGQYYKVNYNYKAHWNPNFHPLFKAILLFPMKGYFKSHFLQYYWFIINVFLGRNVSMIIPYVTISVTEAPPKSALTEIMLNL